MSKLKCYETLMLIRTTTTESELESIEAGVTGLVEKHSGSNCKFDRWGRIRLAYPVEHRDYGYYILARYKVPAQNVAAFSKELQSTLKIKFNNFVIRNAFVSINEDVFDLEYKRPESVQPGASRLNDSFSKDEKIESVEKVAEVLDSKKEKAQDAVLQEASKSVQEESKDNSPEA